MVYGYHFDILAGIGQQTELVLSATTGLMRPTAAGQQS
jgi:hypothetical protein